MTEQIPQINLHQWTYAEFNEFIRASSSGNTRQAGYLLEKVINDWSLYEVPEDMEHPFDHLLFETEAVPLIQAVSAAITEYSKEIDISPVTVDTSKWRWSDFNHFREVSETGNVAEIEKLLHQVCSMRGVKRDQPLIATAGILMMSALTKKVTQVFSGKN